LVFPARFQADDKDIGPFMILGILPTVSNDPAVYREFFRLMERQTLKPDLLAVGYQGEEVDCEYLKERLFPGDWSVETVFFRIGEKSLARAKNILIGEYGSDYDYIFIYEDDVVYEPDYNERMLRELENNGADMISAVPKIPLNIKTFLRACAFSLTHIYPFSDCRFLMSILPFRFTLQTRYLTGGLSMAAKEVFDHVRYDDRLLLYSPGEDMDFSYRASEQYKTLLTNKIRCLHDSRSIRKFEPIAAITAKMDMWSYFFNKNIRKKYFLPQYYLLVASIVAEALMLSLRYGSGDILKAALKTAALNRKGIYTSPFIEGYRPL
jgi:GT2 family glycosyltransferase